MPVAKEVIEILACPVCKSEVVYDSGADRICCVNQGCRREYPVKEGIPFMVVEESTKWIFLSEIQVGLKWCVVLCSVENRKN
jgi:uncharacterized protein YbaR (Trm112 family)